MGAACCKSGYQGSSSPHLPFCEVVRRCARQICPVDPPQQKPVHRIRKYGLSDIVGPVVKKDSWVQTDPLPPPRRRKKKNKQRRRSRSVEFLPYLIRRQSSRGSKNSRTSSCSLEDIRGQEDAIDFQMFFMGKMPVEEGKEVISGKKRQFLSGLLGEENNNFVMSDEDYNIKYDSKIEENKLQTEPNKADDGVPTTTEEELTPAEGQSSRKSSITESLREFESSLLEMLEEDDVSLTKFNVKINETDDEQEVTLMEPIRKSNLTPLPEEKEEEYVFTALDEEKNEKRRPNDTDSINIVVKKEANQDIDFPKNELHIISKCKDLSIEKTEKVFTDVIIENIIQEANNDNMSRENPKIGPTKVFVGVV